MSKFFAENVSDNNITLNNDDFKHIKNVLRHKIGDEILVCDGLGFDYVCEIKSLDDEVLLEILEKSPCLAEPKLNITLFQGLPKFDKMELIIQKCVELGVCDIVPVYCNRSIVKFNDDKKIGSKIDRWQKISLSAAKQSNRGIIPKIHKPVKFNEAVNMKSDFDSVFIAYENEKDFTLKKYFNSFEGTNLGIFIGPEGGFSNEEIEFAIENDVKTVSLGERILRTETAGFFTIGVAIYEMD